MRIRQLFWAMTVAATVAAAHMPLGAMAEQPVQFLPTVQGLWGEPGNWEDYGFGQNVPAAPFDETAVIGSGGIAVVDSVYNQTSTPQGPAELHVTAGEVRILNGAALTMGDIPVGGTSDRSIEILDRLSIVGTGTLGGASIMFGAGATLAIDLSAATASPITVTGSATLNGALNLDYSGIANPSGSKTIITAGSVGGAFSSVSAIGLGAAQTVQVATTVGAVQASVVDLLTMTVNRATGAVTINNPHSHSISLDGYAIRSAAGSLNSASFSGLGSGWSTSASNSSNAASQLFEGTLGSPSASIAGGASPIVSSSGLYVPATPTAFLQDVEDLVFEYTDANVTTPLLGVVNFVGSGKVHNNIVLTIDAGGNAALLNTSPFAQEVEAYRITSTTSPLQAGTWSSLDDQNADDGTWSKSAVSGAGMLLELQEDGTTSFNNATLFNLGKIFDAGYTASGVTFEFLLAGGTDFTEGVVVFGDLPTVGTPGDFDGDGDVDGSDFLRWQRGLSPNGATSTDLNIWRSHFGAAVPSVAGSLVAIPEPTSWMLLLCLSSAAAIAGRARNRRAYQRCRHDKRCVSHRRD
ncbi:MAG: PEP-CTERM sorting domain-containing protein [Pirellulales bacterium]|nr:PEP-CTERM sorting domain-containing protein [Pirellulales bacterium]